MQFLVTAFTDQQLLIRQMNQRHHKMFIPQEGILGRNANISSTMMRKTELTPNNTTERPQTQPFLGYSIPTTENSLGNSQVSEYSNDGIRKLIKEEIQKRLKEEKQKDQKQKSDITIIKAEIKTLKESFIDFTNSNHQQLHQSEMRIQEETKVNIQKMVKDHQKQTALNLKKVVNKMHEDIKKDLTAYIDKTYVPLSFIDDLEKQLNDIQDKIDIMESKFEGNKQIPNKQPIILAESVELKVNKLDREIENVRKIVQQLSQKCKKNDFDIKDIMNMTQQEKQTSKLEIERVKQTVNLRQIEFKKINTFSMFIDNIKFEIQDLKNQIAEMQKVKKQQTVSDINMNSSYEVSSPENMIKNTKSTPQTGQKYRNEQSPYRQEENKDIKKKKIIYKIDSEGFLMDEEGKYLIDQKNSMIILTNEKIKMLQESHLIQFV